MALKSRSLASGTRVASYTIRATLGHGANATVYLAEDRRDGRRVAFKALNNDRDHDRKADLERAAQRMRREVALLGRIQHPGICRVYEGGTSEGMLYVAMEYVEGQTLEAVLRRARKLSSERVTRLMRHISQALAAAHEAQVLHRDLKPGNIMLRDGETPVLLDFGYATAPDVSRVTATGAWVGTLQYVAPEILRNEPATEQSDLYSLGAIAYQLLSGQLPFGGRSYGEVASAKIYQDPPPLTEIEPEVPAELAAIVTRALAREPADRYANVRELEAAFGALVQEEKRREPTLVVRERQTARPPTPTAAPKPTPKAQATPESTAVLQRPAPKPVPAPQPKHREASEAAPERFSNAKAPRLAPKPIPVVERTSPPVPEKPMPPAAASPKEQHAFWTTAIQNERQKKGFVVGDLVGVDALERTAKLELSAGRIEESCKCLRLAFDELYGAELDEAFIRDKLTRFEQTMRQTGGYTQMARLAPILERVMRAFEAKRYVEANRALGEALAILDGPKAEWRS